MKRRSLITGAAAVVAATITDLALDKKATAGEKVNNPLTIIKVGNENYRPSPQDLERWRSIFAGEASVEDYPHMKSQPISAEVFDAEPDYHRLLLVKVGNEKYLPTAQDLEAYRKVFEEAANDKDIKIFTHSAVYIESIRFGAGGIIVDES